MKILVTGFDPFGGETMNPSIESVKRLPDTIAEAEIIKLEIPTVAYKSLSIIKEAILQYQPDMILSVGQAGGRSDITIERVGINIQDFRIQDNEGNQPIDDAIFEDGPVAYFSNLPIKAMVHEIQKAGIPASISNTAGTFVCNHVFYGVRYMLEQEYPTKKSGFIHIPYLPEQVIHKGNIPSMALDVIVEGLICAIRAIVENSKDINISCGTIC